MEKGRLINWFIFIQLLSWVFIPYNCKDESRKINLEKKLEEHFDVNKLKTNPNYSLDAIVKDVRLTKNEGGKIFKEIYASLKGNINQNSLVVYSGPDKKQTEKLVLSSYVSNQPIYRDLNLKAGCIYTGDVDLNKTLIHDIFEGYWNKVGTIQIPHHGDLKTFNIDLLNNYGVFYPVSFATNNKYGHPSNKVISEILASKNDPIMITEKLDSLFVQIIQSYDSYEKFRNNKFYDEFSDLHSEKWLWERHTRSLRF